MHLYCRNRSIVKIFIQTVKLFLALERFLPILPMKLLQIYTTGFSEKTLRHSKAGKKVSLHLLSMLPSLLIIVEPFRHICPTFHPVSRISSRKLVINSWKQCADTMQLFFEESVASDPTNNFMTLVYCGAETDHIPDNNGNVWWYDHYQVGRNSNRFPSTKN